MKEVIKVGLLLPANVYFCPYATIYSRLLDEWEVDYDIICWDKSDTIEKADYIYHKKVSTNTSLFKKLFYYYDYVRFLKKCIKKEKYDKLIVFGPQIALFLYPLLNKYYQGKFILDYRDLSIEQRFMNLYKKVLDISFLNVISSPAFQKCLPKGYHYVISHNINDFLTREALAKEYRDNNSDKLDILTIGAIRDLKQNIELMNALADNQNFIIRFVGKSDLSDAIKDYAIQHNFSNASFVGFYKKDEEGGYIENCSYMNIYYPRLKSHDTALSNRFYNSLIYCKPMIVTKDTIQGDWAEKYGIGIAINSCASLAERLINYRNQFNINVYMKGRNELLSLILKQQDEFIKSVYTFVYSK